MRVVCVYREGQDYSRSVSEWLETFYRRTGRELEVMDPDTNTDFCTTYDIVEYPTIIALGDRGDVRAMWRGQDLPLIDEVSYYTL